MVQARVYKGILRTLATLFKDIGTFKMEGKKTRKLNFSNAENLFLVEKYEQYKDMLEAKHKDANTNRKKRDIWIAIIEQHNSRFSDCTRTELELKNRLTKLKSESKECLLAKKKSIVKK